MHPRWSQTWWDLCRCQLETKARWPIQMKQVLQGPDSNRRWTAASQSLGDSVCIQAIPANRQRLPRSWRWSMPACRTCLRTILILASGRSGAPERYLQSLLLWHYRIRNEILQIRCVYIHYISKLELKNRKQQSVYLLICKKQPQAPPSRNSTAAISQKECGKQRRLSQLKEDFRSRDRCTSVVPCFVTSRMRVT